MYKNMSSQKTEQKILIGAENHLALFTQLDMAEYLTGQRVRAKSVEYNLPRLVKSKKLLSYRVGRKLVYSFQNKQSNQFKHIQHDLMCTQIMLKFQKLCGVEVVSERFFRQSRNWFQLIPDWAVLCRHTVLLCEYSTQDNFNRTALMKKKLAQYRTHLFQFESYFESEIIVLFIYAARRFEVKSFVKNHAKSSDTFIYFTDLKSFNSVEATVQFSSPIYLWGGDGQRYPLSNHV
jgi:hypothetical protein